MAFLQEPYPKLLIVLLQVWDLRQNKLIYNMHGHGDSVTGLSLSSEGSYLLSNSMDNTGTIRHVWLINVVGCMGESCSWSLPVSLCSPYLGCSTICSQGKMCEDFPGQCSQLWKGKLYPSSLKWQTAGVLQAFLSFTSAAHTCNALFLIHLFLSFRTCWGAPGLLMAVR